MPGRLPGTRTATRSTGGSRQAFSCRRLALSRLVRGGTQSFHRPCYRRKLTAWRLRALRMLAGLVAVGGTDRIATVRADGDVDVERGGAGGLTLEGVAEGDGGSRLPIFCVHLLFIRFGALHAIQALVAIIIVKHV